MAEPEVFTYLDFRAYLKDWYASHKEANPRFSYRVLANNVGYRSPGFFTQILQAKSNISIEMALKFGEALGMKKKQRDYFVLLVRYGQETQEVKRQPILQKLALFKDSAAVLLRDDQNLFLEHWYHAAIRERVGIAPCRDREEDICSQLIPSVGAAQVKESLDLLLRLGLAHRTASGIARTDPRLTTGTVYGPAATLRYMKQVHDLGGQALDRFARTERHHAWATVSVSKATLEAMREELRALVQKSLEMASHDDKPDRVMQINLELFLLSQPVARA